MIRSVLAPSNTQALAPPGREGGDLRAPARNPTANARHGAPRLLRDQAQHDRAFLARTSTHPLDIGSGPQNRASRECAVGGDGHDTACPTRLGRDGQRLASLIRELGRQLGINADRLVLRIDAHAERETARRGASALSLGELVWMRPCGFDPDSARGRYLLAHELAHIAQRSGLRLRPDGHRADRAGAEWEAHELGLRAAEQRVLTAPRLLLPATHVAADTGFDEAVRRRYAREIARIKRLLRGVWGFLWVTDGMVEEILIILQSLDFPTVRALLSSGRDAEGQAEGITRAERGKLLRELSDHHRRRYRPEVLAFYSVLEPAILAAADQDIFAGMTFHNLTNEEHFALLYVREHLPRTAWDRLRENEAQRDALNRLEALGASRWNEEEAIARAAERLQRDVVASHEALHALYGDEQLTAVLEEIRATLRGRVRAEDRLRLLDQLQHWMREPNKLRGVAETLQNDERGDLFERWLDDFPVTALYQGTDAQRSSGEARLAVLLRLVSFRDPWRNAVLARELVTQSWFLDIINDEEAWLALQLLNTLPENMRARLLEDRGAALYDNLSTSMRESARANFYSGGEGGTDLASIQTQLLDERLWSVERANRLAGLMRMAIAARQHRWLFEQSREHYRRRRTEYTAPQFLERIVEPFQLFNPEARNAANEPEPREEYRPEYLESVSVGAEIREFISNIPVLGGAVDFFAAVGEGISLATGSRSISVRGGIGAEGVNITELQGMRNLLALLEVSFYGVRFAEQSQLGAAGARALRERRGVNFIDRIRYHEGVFELAAEHLAIAAVSSPFGSLVLQAGAGELRGVELRIASGSAAPSLDVRVRSLSLNDVLFVQPGSMVAINRIELDGLAIRVGRDAMSTWLATPLFQAVQVTGGDAVEGSSLVTPSAPTPLELSLRGARVLGITTSGGQFISSVSLEDVQIGLAGTREDYMEALWRSMRELTRRAVALQRQRDATQDADARAELEARIQRVQAQREAARQLRIAITTAENRVAGLRARRERGEALSSAERDRLAEDQAFLARFERGGVTFDAGRIRVEGVEGAASLEALELTDLHGVGTTATALAGLISGSDMLPRILRGEAYRPQVVRGREREATDFSVDLGTLDVRGLRVTSAIPSVEEARREHTAARERRTRRPWDRDARIAVEESGQRLNDTIAYHRLAAIGVTHLNDAERTELQRLHTLLRSREAFFAHHLHAEGAALTFGGDGRDIGLTAERFEALRPRDEQGEVIEGEVAIRAGAFTIGELHGERVRAGIDLEGGLLGEGATAGDLRSRVRGLTLAGERLQATDVRFGGQDLEADQAFLEDFDIALDAATGVLDARAARAAVEGLRTDISEASLLREIAALEERPEALRGSADSARLQGLRDALDMYRGFLELIERHQAELEAATGVRAREQAQEALRLVLGQFALWRRRLGARQGEVRDLSVRVSGLGRVLEPGYDFDAALQRGITIEGTGESPAQVVREGEQATPRRDRMFSSAEITDARFGAATAQRIAAGEALGRVRYGANVIGLDNIYLERFSATDLFLQAAGHQVWSHGTSTLNGITVNGELRFEADPEDPAERRLAQVELSELRIDSVIADQLGYWNPDRRAQVDIESGRIGGIWASGLRVDLPAGDDEAMRIRGAAGIEALTDVRVNAYVEGVLDYGSGRLNGTGLGVTFLESGGQRIAIEDLSLDQGRVRTAGGEIRVSARHLSGAVEHEGDLWRLRDVRLETLTLQRFAWRSGTRRLRADRPAIVSGIRVDATVNTSTAGDPRVEIERLHADRIAVAHFRYEDLPLVIEVRSPAAATTAAAPGAPRHALEIIDFTASNLRWSPRGGLRAAPGTAPGSVHIESVHAALNALHDDFDLDVEVDTGVLDLRFLQDGTHELSVEDLAGRVEGTAGGVDLNVAVRDVSTGTVAIGADGIDMPALSIPYLAVEHLNLDGARFALNVPRYGGLLSLHDAQANLRIERDPAAEGFVVERVVVRSLVVPEIRSQGLSVTLKNIAGGDDLEISTSHTRPATVRGLRIGARTGSGEGFVIRPDGWTLDGMIAFDQARAQRAAVELGTALAASMDLTATDFELALLESGEWSLDLQRLDVEELYGTAGAHHFNVGTSPRGTAHTGLPPGITVRRLRRGTEGSWSTGDTELRGVVYENSDLGLRIDLRRARLPAGVQIPASGAATLPSLVIEDADFRVNDLSALIGGGGSSSSSGSGMNYREALDALDGTVAFDVEIDSSVATRVDLVPDIHISQRITNGAIDLEAFEDDLGGYDAGIDIDLEGDRLVVNLDWGRAGWAIFPLGGIVDLFPQANTELFAWEGLDPTERAEAARESARVSTLVARLPASSGSGSGSSVSSYIRLTHFDARLNLLGRPLLDLGAGRGAVRLEGDGDPTTPDLTATGNIPGTLTTVLTELTASVEPGSPLHLGPVLASQGSLTIAGLTARQRFSGFSPRRLEGRISRAEASHWQFTIGGTAP